MKSPRRAPWVPVSGPERRGDPRQVDPDHRRRRDDNRRALCLLDLRPGRLEDQPTAVWVGIADQPDERQVAHLDVPPVLLRPQPIVEGGELGIPAKLSGEDTDRFPSLIGDLGRQRRPQRRRLEFQDDGEPEGLCGD